MGACHNGRIHRIELSDQFIFRRTIQRVQGGIRDCGSEWVVGISRALFEQKKKRQQEAAVIKSYSHAVAQSCSLFEAAVSSGSMRSLLTARSLNTVFLLSYSPSLSLSLPLSP